MLTEAVIIFSTVSFAQPTSSESLYLDHAEKFAPTSEVKQDEIIRFEADVTGDGSAETFYTKASLRDGKHGYFWTAFETDSDGKLRLIGEVTFSTEVFAPATLKSDERIKGFYTYFPSGGSRGSLAFFEVTASGIARRESRKIEPTGADKAEFDELFGTRLKGERPKIDLKRTALPKHYSDTSPSGTRDFPQLTEEIAPAAKLTPVVEQTDLSKPKLEQTLRKKPALKTPWSLILVSIMVTIGLLWQLLKKRK